MSSSFTHLVEVHGEPVFWLDTAVAYAKRAQQIDSTQGHAALSYALMNQGHVRAAREEALLELKYVPSNVGSLSMLSLIDRELGDIAASLEWARKGYKLDPKSTYLANHLAVCYTVLGDFSEAARWNAKSKELKPDFVWVVANQNWQLRLQGRVREALQQALAWREREPRLILAQFDVLDGAAAAGEWKIALDAAERLLREAPHQAYGNYRFTAAYVFARTGQRPRADSLLRVLAQENQTNRARSDRLAYSLDAAALLALQGQNDEAIDAFERHQQSGGYVSPAYLLTDPWLESLRKHPGFDRVLQRARERQAEFRRIVGSGTMQQ
ncbi:MAG: hypothetical protein WEE89_04170, partial [Gemmatimonadota bacterium]